MTTTTELFTVIATMIIAGVFLLIMLVKHLKKIAIITIAILIFLSIRTAKLGYAQYYATKAKQSISDTMNGAMDKVEEAGRNLNIEEKVELPDAEDVRGIYYYDTGKRGYGLPEKDADYSNTFAGELIKAIKGDN